MKRLIYGVVVFLILFVVTGCRREMEYSIQFESNGGTPVDTIVVTADSFSMPAEPTRNGYNFDGWYIDNTTFTNPFTENTALDDTFSETIILYAKWDIATYTITYELDGGINDASNPDVFDITSEVVLTNPTKEGYTFGGWYVDALFDTALVLDTIPLEDVTIYAKWNINSYTLEFLDHDATVLQTTDNEYDTDLSSVTPPIPSRVGYTFIGWDITMPSSMPAQNVTLFAQYEINQYTITFMVDDVTPIEPITEEYGTTILAPTNPSKEGYTFGGWFSDEALSTAFVFSSMPATDTTLYPKWNINSFTLQYVDSDFTVLQTTDYEYQTDLSEVVPPLATKEGYTFTGWDILLPTNMPADNITLVAQYQINQYTIQFETNVDSTIDPITQDFDTPVSPPEEPFKEGYVFAGWYIDEEHTTPYTFLTMPAENITLYAGWSIGQFTLTFDTNDGSSIEPTTQDYETILSEPTAPIKEGYLFAGWYIDEDLSIPYDFVTMPGEDITIYAGWINNPYVFQYETTNEITIIDYVGFERYIELPSSYNGIPITSIGEEAFRNADLIRVTIPESITSIGQFAFMGNYLSSVIILGDENRFNDNWDDIYFGLNLHPEYINYEGMIFDPLTGSIKMYMGNAIDLIIPSSINDFPVTMIDENVFEYENCVNITIPASVITIGKDAFRYTNATTVTILGDATRFNDTWEMIGFDSILNPTYVNYQGMLFDPTSGTIKKYLGGSIDIVIPSTINGVPVTTIGRDAFYYTNIYQVTIPNTVTTIEQSAFENNRLTSLTLPDSVESIGKYAFSANFITTVNLPNSLTSIGEYAFLNNELQSLALPTSISTISEGTFVNNNLTSLIIPDWITSIGDSAFSGNRLTSITIPDSVTSIGANAFTWNELTSVTIPDSVISIGVSAFGRNQLTSITIPSSVTSIGRYAFSQNQLTSITIPSSITGIENGAFANNQLTSVILPDSIVTIGQDAFANNQLVTITIPNSVETIGQDAFAENQLATITLPDFITIEADAFSYNPITTVTILGDATSYNDIWRNIGLPNEVHPSYIQTEDFIFDPSSGTLIEYIGDEVDVVIPSTFNNIVVTSIGDYAFANSGLTSVVIPDGVVRIGSHVFINCQLTSVIIPDGVISIGEYAFNGNQLTTLSLPDTLVEIGIRAFAYNQLIDVNIPTSLQTIKREVFLENQLTSLNIPDSVRIIESMAFYHNNLTSVTFSNALTSIGRQAFSRNQLTSVIIPNSVTTIDGLAFSENQLTSVVISDFVVHIAEDVFSENQLTTVTIPDRVITVGRDAFMDNQITSVTIPSSVTSIEYHAFDSNSITEIIVHGDPARFNSSWADIGFEPYLNAGYLIENGFVIDPLTGILVDYIGTDINISVPSIVHDVTVIEIGENAFQDCHLFSVDIPDSVTRINNYAFEGNRLISVNLGNSVTIIGGSAFANNNLTSITLPDSVTYISYRAFESNQLSSVTFPDSLISIGMNSFESNQLETITIPDSVISIQYAAFRGNPISSITILGDESRFNEDWEFFGFPIDLAPGYQVYDGFVFDPSIGTIVAYIGNEQDITIPSEINGVSVTVIGNGAFQYSAYIDSSVPINSVVIPDSVTTIEAYAFHGNTLTSVTLGNGIIRIDDHAFYGNQLTSVIIPDSVEIISFHAFYRNELTSVTLGNNVNIIGWYAFSRNQLTNIVIPESVTIIGTDAFADNLITSVTIEGNLLRFNDVWSIIGFPEDQKPVE